VAVIAAFGLLLAFMGGMIGFAFFQDYYQEHVQLPHSKAMQVGNTTLSVDYFARRLKLLLASISLTDTSQAQAAIAAEVSMLEGEELLRQRAPAELGVSVSPEEVELEIGDRLGLTESNPEALAAAYEPELKKSGLSDKEYRRMVETDLLSSKVQEVFSLSVPQTMEQVRMRQIQVGTEDEALSVVERLNGGEDFGALAQELSLDSATKDKGGERGWVARDELDLSYAGKVLALEVAIPSQPIPGPGGYFIFEVEEKEPEREVTPEQKSTISSSYFSLWLNEQRTLFAVPDIQPLLEDADKLQWAANKAFGL
jgi:parvulin-like peptidyl-prolyl isomerase